MRPFLSLVLSTVITAPLLAQRAPERLVESHDTALVGSSGWPVLRVAKWTSLVASTGAVVYGFTQNRTADADYEKIELLCKSQPDACATVPGSKAYADPALESRYQNVLRRDDRAKLALVAGQVGVAATVLMFIFDLPGSTQPNGVPYEPRAIRMHVRDRQVELGFNVPVR